MIDGHKLLELVIQLNMDCVESGVTEDADKLTVFQFAWLFIAANARNAQLPFPGGYPAEQTRQAEQLRKMLILVETDTPDIETERLFQEGDMDSLVKHLRKQFRKQFNDTDKDDTPQEEGN